MASVSRLALSCSNRIPCVLNCSFPRVVRTCYTKTHSPEYSHLTHKPEEPVREPIEYEISKCPNEWKLVEQILPPKIVPEPTRKPEFPSGWRPAEESAKKLPYYVERSKNHMPGVYLVKTLRGQKTETKIRKIHGDIWALEHDIKTYLQEKHKKFVVSQIHEVTRCIWLKGDYFNDVQEWMLQRGL